MGTPSFAVAPLERLIADGHDIAGVFTQPDKPKGRGMKVQFTPVKELALNHNIPVYQPETLRDGTAMDILRELKCDLIVVVAYGKLLPLEILEFPQFECVNIHASLLPKYRGAGPIQWAVLNGETETGVAAMVMGEGLDTGDVLLCKKTQIGDDETAGGLHDRLSILGAELISETVHALECGSIARTPQNDDSATYAPPLTKALSPIDWSDTAFNIKRKVQGLNPWPVATAEFSSKVYKIFAADIAAATDNTPGTLILGDGIRVACSDGTIIIKELQAPGGKRMSAQDFLRGNTICQ